MQQEQKFASLLFAYLFNPQTKLIPPDESTEGVSSRFARQYLIPLSLLPALSFGIVKIVNALSMGNVIPAQMFADFFGIVISGVISFVVAHFWSVIVDGLVAAKGITAKTPRGYFVTAYTATPWFVTYALFPLIHGFSFIGFIWIAVRMRAALEHIASIPKQQSLKLAIAVCFMWIAAFLFFNLVFAGLMSMLTIAG
jgi:hypothetical protein